MTRRLRAALSVEILVLAAPIASSFGFMLYRTVHPAECVTSGRPCGDITPVAFLVCVLAFGPALWLTARALRRGLAPTWKDVVWLAVANAYVAAAIVVIMLPLAALFPMLAPVADWLAAALIAVGVIALIGAALEPRAPQRS